MPSNVLTSYTAISPLAKFVLREFSKHIFLNKYFINLDILNLNLEVCKFDNIKWENNTLQFCQDKYSEQFLFPIVHLVNGIGSIFEFNSDNLKIIKYPKIEIISKIARM
ncbi:MAG: hypothetical protein QXD03_02300 [Candidatus Anstonellales archaeon]